MNIGDVIETAMWIDGRETPEQRRKFEDDVSAALAAAQSESGLILREAARRGTRAEGA